MSNKTISSDFFQNAFKIKNTFFENTEEDKQQLDFKEYSEIQKSIIVHFIYNDDRFDDYEDNPNFLYIKELDTKFLENYEYFDIVLDDKFFEEYRKGWNTHEALLTNDHYHCDDYSLDDYFEVNLVGIQDSFYFADQTSEIDESFKDFIFDKYDKTNNKVRVYNNEDKCMSKIRECYAVTTNQSQEKANKMWY